MKELTLEQVRESGLTNILRDLFLTQTPETHLQIIAGPKNSRHFGINATKWSGHNNVLLATEKNDKGILITYHGPLIIRTKTLIDHDLNAISADFLFSLSKAEMKAEMILLLRMNKPLRIVSSNQSALRSLRSSIINFARRSSMHVTSEFVNKSLIVTPHDT